MRSSSKKILSYISEAGFGMGVDDYGPPKPIVTSMEAEAKKKQKERRDATGLPTDADAKPQPSKGDKILIDTSIMGSEGPEKMANAITQLSSSPYRAYLAGGAALGAIGRPFADVLTTADRAKKELRAQQTAVQSMTNVSNYYKNLGIPTPSMHPKQDLIKTLQGILTNL